MNLEQMLLPKALRCISLWLNIVFYHSFTLYSRTFFYIYTFQVQNSIQCASASAWIYAAAKKTALFCSTIWGLFRDMQKNMLSKRFKPKPLHSFLLPLTSTFHLFPKSHTTWHFFLINRIFTSSALIEWGGGTMTSLCMHVRVGGGTMTSLYACQSGGGTMTSLCMHVSVGGALWHHFVCMSEWGGHYDITLYACQCGGALWHHFVCMSVWGGHYDHFVCMSEWGGHYDITLYACQCGGGTMTSLCMHVSVGGHYDITLYACQCGGHYDITL